MENPDQLREEPIFIVVWCECGWVVSWWGCHYVEANSCQKPIPLIALLCDVIIVKVKQTAYRNRKSDCVTKKDKEDEHPEISQEVVKKIKL